MKKNLSLRKLLGIIAMVGVVSSTSVSAFAKEIETSISNTSNSNYILSKLNNSHISKIYEDGIEYESIRITDKDILNDLIATGYIELPEGASEIVEYEILNKTFNNLEQSPEGSNFSEIKTRSYSISNIVKDPTIYYDVTPIRESIYSAPGGTMTISQSISASWNASVNVSSKIISTGLGWNVEEKYLLSDSQIIDTGNYKYAKCTAYTREYKYTFDINGGLFSRDGKGEAFKPFGVRFEIIKFN